eukprot:Filipodium_phascolosomae@DN112_c0_g1_i2.p1
MRAVRAAKASADPVQYPLGNYPRRRYPPNDNPKDAHLAYWNIAVDPRVYRGFPPFPPVTGQQKVVGQTKSRHSKKEHEEVFPIRPNPPQLDEVPPPPGRKNLLVQTDSFLEELVHNPEVISLQTQTDLEFLTPVDEIKFIPTPSGVDKFTQIEEGELFSFDRDVEPILEVLVQKTIDLAVNELMQELELEYLLNKQKEFEDQRMLEQLELQRLQHVEVRRQQEIARRKEQATQQKEASEILVRKLLARDLARSYLHDVTSKALDAAEKQGCFENALTISTNAVESSFLPWLTDSVVSELNRVSETTLSAVNTASTDTIINRLAKQENYVTSLENELKQKQEEKIIANNLEQSLRIGELRERKLMAEEDVEVPVESENEQEEEEEEIESVDEEDDEE